MGTEVHCKGFLLGYHPMMDLNEDSSGSSWTLFCGDKTLRNGHFNNGFMPSTASDPYPGYDKDVLKQKMLEHEVIFKNQVYELHRLYRIQRDMMEEIKGNELRKHCLLAKTSSSPSRLSSRVQSEGAWNWHTPHFKLENFGYAKPSTPGTEILSFREGHCSKRSRASPLNDCSAKECEVLLSRPTKVRKKLFDLHLSADKYIDTDQGRQFRGNDISEIPSSPSRNHKHVSEGSARWFLGDGGRADFRGSASTSHSHLKDSIALSDLNEHVQADETMASTSVSFLGCSNFPENGGLDLSKLKTDSLGFPKPNGLNSHGSSNGTLNHLSSNAEIKERENSFAYKAGNSQGNCNLVAQCLRQDKLPVASHPTQALLNKANQSSGFLPTNNFFSENMQRERTDCFSYNQVEPLVASQLQRSASFLNSANLANSCSQSVSSWGKPTSSLTQKLTEVNVHPSLNSITNLNRISQPLAQKHDCFGVKWHVNGNSSLSVGSQGDLLMRHGFYHGSSLGYKEQSAGMQPISLAVPNCNSFDNVETEYSISHRPGKFSKSSTFVDLNFEKDMNSNGFVPENSINEVVSHHNFEDMDGRGKCDNHLAVLPWCSRAKQSCKNEAIDTNKDSNSLELGFTQASADQLLYKRNVKDINLKFSQSVVSASGTPDNNGTKERGETLSSTKGLGFSIFDNSPSKKEPSLLLFNSAICCAPDGGTVTDEGKNEVIDINVPFDSSCLESEKTIDVEMLVAEKAVETKATSFRNHIDLNSYMNEEEDLLAPSVASTFSNVKIPLEIDLEAPVIPESEEVVSLLEEHGDSFPSQQKHTEQDDNEFVRKAAEVIVAISSSVEFNHVGDDICQQYEALSAEPLLWFVEIVSSCEDGLKNNCIKESNGKDGGIFEKFSPDEIDYFEVMTLLLEETKEEDYMPKPFVPEIQKVEETGASSFQNRVRKGHSKRGRQRRDFQRDILPSLASLSRHEVTEDFLTFGRLMRAAGHPWNSGLTRRNGTGRGRRRLVTYPSSPVLESSACSPLMEQLKNLEMGFEDRSLTGWGKTTRRPRRQRCPAANPPIVALT